MGIMFKRLAGAVSIAVSVAILSVGPVAAAPQGPYLVRDIKASGSSNPYSLTDLDGVLMFAARGGGKGFELWRSDGTAGGTRRVKDINPGGPGSGPDFLTAINGLLYFSASDGDHGGELWTSDGTNAGTRLVKDINPGGGSSYPHSFTYFKGKVYFAAESATAAGFDLWRTDGTTAGTHQVKDSAGSIGWLTAFSGKLFFPLSVGTVNATDTLYVSDGTTPGTRPFRDKMGDVISGGGDGTQGITWLTDIGSTMLFVRSEGELWRTRGSARTTKKIADGPAWEMTRIGTAAFFMRGSQLWRSDGTVAGTQFVADFASGIYGPLAELNESAFFFTDGPDGGPWTSDGTPAGTQPVGVSGLRTDTPTVVLDGVVYFGGWGASDDLAPVDTASASVVPGPLLTLWRSDGTAAGTYSVGDPESHMGDPAVVGDSVYFGASTVAHGMELWRYVP
jgi:ELWxxDGT repeat protein